MIKKFLKKIKKMLAMYFILLYTNKADAVKGEGK